MVDLHYTDKSYSKSYNKSYNKSYSFFEAFGWGNGLLYDFSRSKSDLYNIWTCTDVAAATDLLYEPHRASMNLIDESVKWRRVTANHTAIIQLLSICRFHRVICYVFCHFIISQTPDLVYRLVATRVCFWIVVFDILNYYIWYIIYLIIKLLYYILNYYITIICFISA